MPNTKLDRGFTSTGGKPVKAWVEKLKKSTEEVSQVQGYYREELAREFPSISFGRGADSSERPYMDSADMLNLTGRAKSDGLFNCKCYLTDSTEGTSIEKPFLLMIEAKLDVDFSNLDERAKVLLQALCYLKLIDENGYYSQVDQLTHKQMPAVIVLGSKVNCGSIATKALLNLYPVLSKTKIYGYTSPSTAYEIKENAGFLDILKNNQDINKAFILRDIENGLYDLCSDIMHFAVGADVTEDVTEKNITKAYQRFDIYVLKKKKAKIDGVDVVVDVEPGVKRKAFLSLLLADDSKVTYVESASAKGKQKFTEYIKINFSGDILEVDHRQFDTFKVLYSMKEYTPKEKEVITAVADRLIMEDSRRFKGDYYTPEVWVDEAYKLIGEKLGSDWLDNSIVWDCAWGTGNLTRNQFNFGADKYLYCSTLRDEDIGIANDAGYNPNACKFQYDFLNADVTSFEYIKSVMYKPFSETWVARNPKVRAEVSKRLTVRGIVDLYAEAVESGVLTAERAKQALDEVMEFIRNTELYVKAPGLVNELIGADGSNKQIVFIMNPPYGTSKNNSTNVENNSKAGIAITSIRDIMTNNKLGMAQRQLYTQFLFRCSYLMDIFGCKGYIAAFTQSDFMTTVSYGDFRNYFYNKNKYLGGFMFSGGHFSNVSPDVGVSFTVWEHGNSTDSDTVVKIKDTCDDAVVSIRDKKLVAAPKLFNVEIRNRLKELAKSAGRKEVLALKSGLEIKEGIVKDTCIGTAIGGFQCNSNDVNQNAQRVALFSSKFYGAANMDVTPETFDDAVALFAARRVIRANYINWKDEYMTPDKSNPLYEEFQNDCIVFSLFESKSQQTAMRGISVNGKDFSVCNEFFWLSRKSMLDLAKGNIVPGVFSNAIITDINTYGDHERFVYNRLKGIKLSDEANAVMMAATDLLIKTFKYRDDADERLSLCAWDAGWYQIKGLADEYFKEDYKYFTKLFAALSDKIRQRVYELGLLYK